MAMRSMIINMVKLCGVCGALVLDIQALWWLACFCRAVLVGALDDGRLAVSGSHPVGRRGEGGSLSYLSLSLPLSLSLSFSPMINNPRALVVET